MNELFLKCHEPRPASQIGRRGNHNTAADDPEHVEPAQRVEAYEPIVAGKHFVTLQQIANHRSELRSFGAASLNAMSDAILAHGEWDVQKAANNVRQAYLPRRVARTK